MGPTFKNLNGGSNQTDKRLRPSSSRSSESFFDELDRDKAAHLKTVTSKIDYEAMNIVKKAGKHVNAEKMMGNVPGVEVGDEFQYKVELSLIGLHFKICGGIDYMETRHMKLATSIVASEGSGYNDHFESDTLIYSGEGGTSMPNDQKLLEDQRLVKGNLALANCVKEKSEVRVIRGLKRADNRGKHYVYDGRYVVQEYWPERGRTGR